MEKTKVLGTGLSGLVGSRLVDLLNDRYEFTNLDLSLGVNILDPATIDEHIKNSPAQVLLHLAAFTDLNAAEQQKGDKSGSVYQVNVVGTENIAQACARYGKHLVHMSTGYVFDGQKADAYTEADSVNPIDWYGQTKVWAEEAVQRITPTATILRINLPYRTDDFPKKDLWHKIAEGLQAGKNGPFFSDHYFTLTPIEWLAPVIDWCIRTQPTGIYHATTDTIYTDLSLATEIRDQLRLTQELLGSSVHEFNKTAPRQYAPSLILSSEKLKHSMNE